MGTSEDAWCFAGPMAVPSLLRGKIWMWSLSASGPHFGDAVATRHPQESDMKGISVDGSS